ncbi:LPD29 domain-containing protein [Burkholderia sp. Tr-20390]|uniref:LPD29 domain-containing protein n=1 Tax=Burkholderia sp. Tr-20390 TaxID=2703904 RepID=UPI003217FDC5|nr:hypothetical protein [Burkholderia sp. Tr-20390]
MAIQHFTCAQTAALIRKALKEAFPGVKFGVRSHTYSGGASISVSWTDGPNVAQVDDVATRFKGAYFDGSIDYQGSIYHMMGGQQVRFGADYVNTRRDHSPEAIERAIDTVFRRLRGNFRDAGIDRPTVDDFTHGRLWNVQLMSGGRDSVQAEINNVLCKHSDRLKVVKSPTAGSVFVTHDDGYSRTNGAGMSAVAVH